MKVITGLKRGREGRARRREVQNIFCVSIVGHTVVSLWPQYMGQESIVLLSAPYYNLDDTDTSTKNKHSKRLMV